MSLVQRLGSSGLGLADTLIRSVAESGAGWPFELVLKTEARVATLGPVRQRAYREELELLDRFLSHLGITDPAVRERAHRERTMASWLRDSRRFYRTLSPARRRVWMPLAPDLEATVRQGALLLGTHFGGALVAALALSQLRLPMFVIARSRPGSLPLSGTFEFCDLRKESAHRAMMTARARLRRGEIVFLAGDVPSAVEDGNFNANVLGRTRKISRGFAELSLAASVAPTPIFSRVEASGKIYTWLEPALAVSGDDRTARLSSLASAYERVVSTVFSRHPGNVPARALRAYFDSPPYDPTPASSFTAADRPRVAAVQQS